jgi:thiamine-monophosphate kinase
VLAEFERIGEIRRRLSYESAEVVLGIGDDAAILAPTECGQVCSVDTQVEGVHFRLDRSAPPDIGERALVVALSDLAAMGATPRAALVSLIVPTSLDETILFGIVDGIARTQHTYACPVVGGNLARGGELSITTTVLGAAPTAPLTRGGARPGDGLFVTGELGSAACGLALLLGNRANVNHPFVQRWQHPVARIAEGRRLAGVSSAAIDISDGLLQDLGHIAQASGVGFELTLTTLPLHPDLLQTAPSLGLQAHVLALTGGEDYELAFTVPVGREPPLGTRIGTVTSGPQIRVLDPNGHEVDFANTGFDHFE